MGGVGRAEEGREALDHLVPPWDLPVPRCLFLGPHATAAKNVEEPIWMVGLLGLLGLLLPRAPITYGMHTPHGQGRYYKAPSASHSDCLCPERPRMPTSKELGLGFRFGVGVGLPMSRATTYVGVISRRKAVSLLDLSVSTCATHNPQSASPA